LHNLARDFGLTAVVGCEIEFYLIGSTGKELTPFWRELRGRLSTHGVDVFCIEKERGEEQYEVSLKPADAIKAGADMQCLKKLVNELAINYGMRADFSAKPVPEQPGSGLHVHVHLSDALGSNVFYKDDAIISDMLKYAIGGLVERLWDDLPIFAPTAASRERFRSPDHHTPTTISWGANNRTCAIRLPDSDNHIKRIEHRVSGADADPCLVIEAILAAIHWGITNRVEPPPQCYVDANLEKHGLQKLFAD
jgi:glutamine synthetase